MRGTKPVLVADNASLPRIPAAPEFFGRFARDEWYRIMPMLIERRMITDADRANFENYCIAQGHVREFQADMATVNDIASKARLFRMQNQAMQTAKQLAAELGLTPMARSRTSMQGGLFDYEDQADDPLNLS